MSSSFRVFRVVWVVLLVASAGCGDVAIVQNTCDGEDAGAWFRDADDDGRGDVNDVRAGCEQPDGYVPDATDCDDEDPDIHPGADELCDGIDNDCVDGPDADEAGEVDADEDGWLSCEDCDDFDPDNAPEGVEVCDGRDNDCNGEADFDEAGEVDADEDGSLSCEDCDDDDPDNTPGAAEVCDGFDNDCNGVADFDEAEEIDFDEDGSLSCEDCDDADSANTPGGVEVCDGQDNDCNGLADMDVDGEVDADSDGILSCLDCNDADPANAPGGVEICDGIDNDCNGLADFGSPGVASEGDADSDGSIACLDCDDQDPANTPGAVEVCDGQDNDCNGLDDAGNPGVAGWETDNDFDLYSECDGDCDDAEPAAFPFNPEICDGIDNDCDGIVPATELDLNNNGVLDCNEGGGGGVCPSTGMTWALTAHDAALGVDTVGCDGCQPYVGDQNCTSIIPVLCIEPIGLADPGLAGAGFTLNYYFGWSGGNVAASTPVEGCTLTSLSVADAVCSAQFGAGWRMAEFHDGGGGWNFYAFGNLANSPTRMWTYINDQPANCWN